MRECDLAIETPGRDDDTARQPLMKPTGNSVLPLAQWADHSGSSPVSIKPIRLAETIARHIQQLILEGILHPGERLANERDLSVKLGVSRPSLREGLDILVQDRLLVRDASGVAYVSQDIGKSFRDPLVSLMNNPDARQDLMELRCVLEAAAAAFAAERASEVNRDQLHDRMQAMLAAHDSDNVNEIARTDIEFHFAIYEASHNIMVIHFMRSVEDLLTSTVYSNRENLFKHRANPVSQLTEHKAIYDAIMARDPEAAQTAARMHMQTAIATQKSIHEAELRLEASIRRLSHDDLVAAPRGRK